MSEYNDFIELIMKYAKQYYLKEYTEITLTEIKHWFELRVNDYYITTLHSQYCDQCNLITRQRFSGRNQPEYYYEVEVYLREVYKMKRE